MKSRNNVNLRFYFVTDWKQKCSKINNGNIIGIVYTLAKLKRLHWSAKWYTTQHALLFHDKRLKCFVKMLNFKMISGHFKVCYMHMNLSEACKDFFLSISIKVVTTEPLSAQNVWGVTEAERLNELVVVWQGTCNYLQNEWSNREVESSLTDADETDCSCFVKVCSTMIISIGMWKVRHLWQGTWTAVTWWYWSISSPVIDVNPNPTSTEICMVGC